MGVPQQSGIITQHNIYRCWTVNTGATWILTMKIEQISFPVAIGASVIGIWVALRNTTVNPASIQAVNPAVNPNYQTVSSPTSNFQLPQIPLAQYQPAPAAGNPQG